MDKDDTQHVPEDVDSPCQHRDHEQLPEESKALGSISHRKPTPAVSTAFNACIQDATTTHGEIDGPFMTSYRSRIKAPLATDGDERRLNRICEPGHM
jgi:hypothetical protein